MDVTSVINQTHGLLLDNLPVRNRRTSSGWRVFNCPLCGDKRTRAGVIQSGLRISYHCFNCGEKAGWAPFPGLSKKYRDLVQRLGASAEDIHRVTIALMTFRSQLEELDDSLVIRQGLSSFNSVELPSNCELISDLPEDHELKTYARHRGILELGPLLHFPDDALYKRRVIIPYMYDGEIVGWTGRHVAPPTNSVPKYLSKVQPGYVYNVDKFLEERDIIIVVEGVIDAMLLDSVAVLSNSVSDAQAQLINKLGKRIIVLPDRDPSGLGLVLAAVNQGWEVSFPPWHSTCKDAADACDRYGRLLTVASIIKHATKNPVKIQVQSKLMMEFKHD